MRKPKFDLYVRENFLTPQICEQIISATKLRPESAATVYASGSSGQVEERMRKTSRLAPPAEIQNLVTGRLIECQAEVAEHFGLVLSSCDEPQFLRYRQGDFFVAHQDGNTGLTKLEQEERRVSVIIFLSRQSESPNEGDYCGGSLVFSDWRPGNRGELEFASRPGMLLAFRAETTHEVRQVTSGERYTIACWYR